MIKLLLILLVSIVLFVFWCFLKVASMADEEMIQNTRK